MSTQPLPKKIPMCDGPFPYPGVIAALQTVNQVYVSGAKLNSTPAIGGKTQPLTPDMYATRAAARAVAAAVGGQPYIPAQEQSEVAFPQEQWIAFPDGSTDNAGWYILGNYEGANYVRHGGVYAGEDLYFTPPPPSVNPPPAPGLGAGVASEGAPAVGAPANPFGTPPAADIAAGIAAGLPQLP